MSNIPSSAMPHAWAPLNDEEVGAVDRNTAAVSPSFAMLAGLGAFLAYLVYRVVR